MREIEYRAWDVKREHYFQPSRLCFESMREGWAWVHDGSMYICPVILEQFTGKYTDIEDCPIFEGDILKDLIHNEKGKYLQVIWDEEYASFRAKNKNVSYGLCGLTRVELVGNIHETPELIK